MRGTPVRETDKIARKFKVLYFCTIRGGNLTMATRQAYYHSTRVAKETDLTSRRKVVIGLYELGLLSNHHLATMLQEQRIYSCYRVHTCPRVDRPCLKTSFYSFDYCKDNIKDFRHFTFCHPGNRLQQLVSLTHYILDPP